jgi:hypothetical protein
MLYFECLFNPPTFSDSLIYSIIGVGVLIVLVLVFFIVKLLRIKPKYKMNKNNDFDEIQDQNSFANISLDDPTIKI